MPVCAIVTCKNRSGIFNLSRGGVSYHRFPRDPNMKAKWVATTGRPKWWSPTNIATICSHHFDPYDFVKKIGKRHYLHEEAVPSRFIALSRPNLITRSNLKQPQAVEINIPQQSNVPHPRSIPSRENFDDVTSIEIEIMPENQVILHPHKTGALEKAQEDKNLIELMHAKIQEQEILIRKLKVRNCRLKKRLFSLKSMEG